MRINESVFRKILREEARRVLNEAEGTPPAAAPAGATPAGGTGAVSGPATAAATRSLTEATARHAAAYKAAEDQAIRLVALDQNLGLKVKTGIFKLKDPNSPDFATLQAAVDRAGARGTAKGVAGQNLMLFATLATGNPVSDWKVAVKALGYQSQIGAEAAKLDDPSKIVNPDAALKSLIGTATTMGSGFSNAVLTLFGTGEGVRTAAGAMAPKAGAAVAPAPGTAPAAAGPAKDWPGYNVKVRDGGRLNAAWTDFVTSPANKQGYNASFGSFVKFYNASIKQQGVKAISPENMRAQLRKLIADAGLTPVTIAPDTSVPNLGGGALQGVEANAAAQAAATAASMQNVRAPIR